MKSAAKIQPRIMTLEETASYWGLSANTFWQLMLQGVAPGRLDIAVFGRLLFDREQQDRAIDALRQQSRV
jgi:hypothetical protein